MMNEKRYPLVSFCVIAYKAEKYIKEAIQGAFSQDYPNMEIILSDDGSPDKTFDIMQQMAAEYKGPHKIILNRNNPNIGPRDHYCKVFYDLAHGDIMLIADGDDISLSNRTKVTVNFLNAHPDVVSLSFSSQLIDENGRKFKILNQTVSTDCSSSIYTISDYVDYDLWIFSDDSRAFRRKVFASFPKLKYPFSEDVFLFVRCILLGSIAYLRQPLVLYRQHSNSIMGQSRQKKQITSENIAKFEQETERQIIEDFRYAIARGYINSSDVPEIERKLRKLIWWLRPKRNSYWRNSLRRVLNRIECMCINLSRKLA